jgi:hypothetical protein
MSELPMWPLLVRFLFDSVIAAFAIFILIPFFFTFDKKENMLTSVSSFFLTIYAALSLAPLVVNVNPNVNVILTACLTVYVGCYRSVKPTPPAVRNMFFFAMYMYLLGIALTCKS